MPRKQPATAPHGPRIRDERQKLVRELIAKARRLLDATPDNRHEPAEELVRELIDTALFSLDLADVRWGALGPKRAAHPGLTRGTIAASEFVRRAEASLRTLLPDANRDQVEARLRLRLDGVYEGPGRGRGQPVERARGTLGTTRTGHPRGPLCPRGLRQLGPGLPQPPEVARLGPERIRADGPFPGGDCLLVNVKGLSADPSLLGEQDLGVGAVGGRGGGLLRQPGLLPGGGLLECLVDEIVGPGEWCPPGVAEHSAQEAPHDTLARSSVGEVGGQLAARRAGSSAAFWAVGASSWPWATSAGHPLAFTGRKVYGIAPGRRGE